MQRTRGTAGEPTGTRLGSCPAPTTSSSRRTRTYTIGLRILCLDCRVPEHTRRDCRNPSSPSEEGKYVAEPSLWDYIVPEASGIQALPINRQLPHPARFRFLSRSVSAVHLFSRWKALRHLRSRLPVFLPAQAEARERARFEDDMPREKVEEEPQRLPRDRDRSKGKKRIE